MDRKIEINRFIDRLIDSRREEISQGFMLHRMECSSPVFFETPEPDPETMPDLDRILNS